MRSPFRRLTAGLFVATALVATTAAGAGPVGAAEAPVGLGTASSFAVLASSTVTNTGPSLISGDLGVSPSAAVTGFPPGAVVSGTIHEADAVAAEAQLDVTTAYVNAAGRTPSATGLADLSGQTLVSGVYSGSALGLTGALTLDAEGDANAVFIFQAGSTLITGPNSVVQLTNGAQACNVYWQVGSSATLGTHSVFIGTLLALASVTATTGASVSGRLFARNGAVTLDSNTITRSTCAPTNGDTTTPANGDTTTPTNGDTTTPANGDTTTPAPGSGTADGIGDTTSGETTSDGGPGGSGAAGGATPSLPATGGQTIVPVIGLLAIALGALVLLASRQRRPL